MGHQLYPYQERGFVDLQDGFRKGGRRGLLVLPCGGGKTSIAAHVINGTVQKGGGGVLFVAHRKELIDQASKRLTGEGIRHGILMADEDAAPWLPVQVASIQTLTARRDTIELKEPRLIIVDEAHRVMGDSYVELIRRFPKAWVLGLSATPFRLDGRGLGDMFDFSVVAATPKQLIDQGYLVQPKGFTCPTAEDGQVNQAVVERWLDSPANGRRTILFAASVVDSISYVEKFRAVGVKAEHLDGTTPKAQREGILARLASGETTVVGNCSVLTEGYDLKPLECVIIARPTESLSWFLQAVGRAMRKSPETGKKFARIHDHTNAMVKHGLPEWDRDYSLTASVVSDDKGPRIRDCPKCHRICAATDARCSECGHVFSSGGTGEGRQVELIAAPVVDLDAIRRERDEKLAGIRGRIRRQDKAGEYKRLMAIAARKGYRPLWAVHRYQHAFDELPQFTADELRSVEARSWPLIPLELLGQPGGR